MNKAIGKLFLIPNTIGDVSPEDVMSHFIRDAINTTQYFVFEKEKLVVLISSNGALKNLRMN